MKRSRFSRRARHTPDVEALLRMAQAYAQASSRAEDIFWETRLTHLIQGLLKADDDEPLNLALDQLYNNGDRAYDRLADLVEACCECRFGDNDLLLFAAPVLAWSRFNISSGPIAQDVLDTLRVQLQAHVLAADVKLGLADFMYSPDQLPQGYGATAQLMDKLAKAALHERNLHIDPAQQPETVNFLSDTRYLLGVLAVPKGAAMFRWQEDDASRDSVLKVWHTQGDQALRPLLPGCALETLLPQAFFSACREADRASRPYATRAAVSFLQTTLNLAPGQLRAVVAPFFDQRLEEYRIGFTQLDASDVMHGVVWPLLEAEDETTEIAAQIEAVLREAGLTQIQLLDHRFPLEFCDDCGAPLYPNPNGEPVHAEMPEEQLASAPRHLH